jgi:anti-sigma regulatory factor (Ser/Thr protein kinase)
MMPAVTAASAGSRPRCAACLAGVGVVGQVFRASYPGVPEAVGTARHDVADVLAEVPVIDDVVFSLGEVATNAIVHSRSGEPGGSFVVSAGTVPGNLVTIAVTDQGGPWQEGEADFYLHGLEIVRQLAAEVRVEGGNDGRTARIVFAWAAA